MPGRTVFRRRKNLWVLLKLMINISWVWTVITATGTEPQEKLKKIICTIIAPPVFSMVLKKPWNISWTLSRKKLRREEAWGAHMGVISNIESPDENLKLQSWHLSPPILFFNRKFFHFFAPMQKNDIAVVKQEDDLLHSLFPPGGTWTLTHLTSFRNLLAPYVEQIVNYRNSHKEWPLFY